MTANQIAYWKLQEEKRSNLAKELEEKRSNLAEERENTRSHRAQEQNAGSLLAETSRSNRAREKETKRHNVVSEFGAGGKLLGDAFKQVAKLVPLF